MNFAEALQETRTFLAEDDAGGLMRAAYTSVAEMAGSCRS